jgi:hypothetical protein
MALYVYCSGEQEKFRANETICGLVVAIPYAVAHPMKQGVQHEPVTEQTNRK